MSSTASWSRAAATVGASRPELGDDRRPPRRVGDVGLARAPQLARVGLVGGLRPRHDDRGVVLAGAGAAKASRTGPSRSSASAAGGDRGGRDARRSPALTVPAARSWPEPSLTRYPARPPQGDGAGPGAAQRRLPAALALALAGPRRRAACRARVGPSPARRPRRAGRRRRRRRPCRRRRPLAAAAAARRARRRRPRRGAGRAGPDDARRSAASSRRRRAAASRRRHRPWPRPPPG